MSYSTLETLAKLNGTDKYEHNYMPLYSALFEPFRFQSVRIIEIGFSRGRGARTLAEYFPRGVVHSFDYEASEVRRYLDIMPDDIRRRIKLYQCDQSKESDLTVALNAIAMSPKNTKKRGHKPFHIILDDGSHEPEHQLLSFRMLWPHVDEGGYYIIEDMHPFYKDGQHATLTYFMNQVHKINKDGNIRDTNAAQSDIDWIMFPYNRIVIRKRVSTEVPEL